MLKKKSWISFVKLCNKIWCKKFAKKADLASLKLEVDKLDVHKLKFAPIGLSELSNVVDNDVYDNLSVDYNTLLLSAVLWIFTTETFNKNI